MDQKKMDDKKVRRGRKPPLKEEHSEDGIAWEQRIIELARVTRVMAGGKRMRFRACVAVGDRQGHIGIGVAKGIDVTLAIQKASNKAKKQIITIPMVDQTIPHQVSTKYKAAKVLIRPAPAGKGIVAGGAMRHVFELGGVPNVVGKILGSKNKINNLRATIAALQNFRSTTL